MKLIILNGPTGVGKSTLARQLQQQISSAVLIDVDELRRTIPDYQAKPNESLGIAYQKTEDQIRELMSEDRDVIIDKTIAQSDVLDRFISVAQEYDAQIYEFLLTADKNVVQQRADQRGYKPGGLLTAEKVGEHWDRADKLREQRVNAVVIDTTSLSAEEALNLVKTSIK